MVQASGEQGEMRRGMTRASSEMELVAHKKQVLLAAHGGVWDAHSSVERAVLMKAAIHSMTEAGLDEEVAQKVRGPEDGDTKAREGGRERMYGREQRGAWRMSEVRGGGREQERSLAGDNA